MPTAKTLTAPRRPHPLLRLGALAAALLAPTAWAAPFTDNGDGTVTDAATGLMWDRCAWGQTGAACADGSATGLPWAQALAAAQTANANTNGYKGHSDWRLPNVKELESLVNRSVSNPAIDGDAFPNTPASYFWSSTTYAPNPAFAWVVYFVDGDTGAGGKSFDNSVRLVRSGQCFAFFDALTPPTPPTATLAAAVPGPNGTMAHASATVDQAARGWWLVLPAASPAPTAAAIKSTGTATGALAPNVASTIAIGNLTPGTAYELYFVAESDCGNQSAVQSQPFATPNVPGAPAPVGATPGAPGSGTVEVSWTVPANNGSAITGYTVAPAGTGAACTASPCTLTGLSNGVQYTFSVTATNGVGTGAPATSAAVWLQGTQAISFANPGPRTLGSAAPLLTATGGASGQPVTFSSSTPGVCTVTPQGQLSLVGAGNCTITASQAGSDAWAAAPDVPQTFAVNALPTPVPTLGQWALALLAGAMGWLAALRRRVRA